MSNIVLENPQTSLANGDSPRCPRAIHYPRGDGKPVAETVEHREAIFYAIHAAQQERELKEAAEDEISRLHAELERLRGSASHDG